MSDIYLTKEGYKKILLDLQNLKLEKLDIEKEIEETRAQGDLKENAGYQYAKEKHNLLLKRIFELEEKIRNSKILEQVNIDKNEIRIGATVKLLDKKNNKEIIYKMVSSDESDPPNGKISVSSPLAQGLLGGKVGEIKKINLPNTLKEFEIISIEY